MLIHLHTACTVLVFRSDANLLDSYYRKDDLVADESRDEDFPLWSTVQIIGQTRVIRYKEYTEMMKVHYNGWKGTPTGIFIQAHTH